MCRAAGAGLRRAGLVGVRGGVGVPGAAVCVTVGVDVALRGDDGGGDCVSCETCGTCGGDGGGGTGGAEGTCGTVTCGTEGGGTGGGGTGTLTDGSVGGSGVLPTTPPANAGPATSAASTASGPILLTRCLMAPSSSRTSGASGTCGDRGRSDADDARLGAALAQRVEPVGLDRP